MTRTQIQQVVVILLLILFVGAFLLNKKGPELNRPAAGLTLKPGTLPETADQTAAPPVPALEISAPDLSIPRDVFLLPELLTQRLQQRDREAAQVEQTKAQQKNPLVETPSTPQLELQGIFWGVAKPQAIINRQIVSIGDHVEGAEVESITRDSVVLSKNGQNIELKSRLFRRSGE